MLRFKSIGLVALLAAMFWAAPNAQCANNAFTDNGSIAKALEEKVEKEILNNEINSIGFSLYQRGPKHSDDAQAYVSSNPRREFVDRHLKGYCSTQFDTEVKAGCQAPAGVPPDDVKYLELGDIKASSLLSPDKYTEYTSYLAQNLIRTLINPFPESKIRRALEDGSLDSNIDTYADLLAAQAARGIPLFSFNEIFAMRATGAELGASAGADKSIMMVMENEFTRRFYNKADLEDILNAGGTDELVVLKEMARMQAADLWLKYLSFRQAERIEALLATGVAQSISSALASKKAISGMGKRN